MHSITYGRNVLKNIELQDNKAQVVLAAAGDIRNVFETHAMKHDSMHVTFVLNDLSVSVLALNMVLLELICRLWPTKGPAEKTAGSTLLHIWGSIMSH